MKKGKRLSKVDGLRVLTRAYFLIKKRYESFINKRINEVWFDSLDEDIRLYILHTLINIYNDNDHPDIVERIVRKIRSIF